MVPVAPSELSGVPHPGVYCWWDLNSAITWPHTFPVVEAAQPLYIGLAAGKGGLAERGVKMHLESTRMSGFRRNLLSLLHAELNLFPGVIAHPKRKMSLDEPYESELTGWMSQNLLVTWVEHSAPRDVERDVIDAVLPPLNSDFAHRGGYWVHTDRVRAELHAAAMAAGQARGF